MKKKKEKSTDRSASRKINKTKQSEKGTNNRKAIEKSTKSARSSARRKRTPVKKERSKECVVSDPDMLKTIFDPITFTFKNEKIIDPGVDNQTSAQKKAFENFARKIVGLGVEGLIKEYETNIVGFMPNGYYSRVIFDKNTPLKKNRYKDVVCNDLTRVILRDGRPGDYIHANYVRGLRPQIILTQGPITDSVFDFWRMILQENVQLIVMLCEHIENGKKKCSAYFPLHPGKTPMELGDMLITTESVNQLDSHIISTIILVQDRFLRKSIRIVHHRIITWPDKTVAKSNLCILRTLRFVRAQKNPVVVHCSAGIGRTGTFAAIEVGIQAIMNGNAMRMTDIVRAIRHCRINSVQMDTQFLMLAEAIIDCGKSFRYINDPQILESFEEFKTDVAQYVQEHPPPPEKMARGGSRENTTVDDFPDQLPKIPQTPKNIQPPQQQQNCVIQTVAQVQAAQQQSPAQPIRQPGLPTNVQLQAVQQARLPAPQPPVFNAIPPASTPVPAQQQPQQQPKPNQQQQNQNVDKTQMTILPNTMANVVAPNQFPK
ncbi:unnamed protein product [Caenorhabditis angaria]|uniref:Uncharacterized protein n=1 Tax=Caenorhabditis angaria TaxID=860376 RepID=A0A9P1MWP4_9PELO|nr:unnamed protein product [Caenorhabditis angaria]